MMPADRLNDVLEVMEGLEVFPVILHGSLALSDALSHALEVPRSQISSAEVLECR